VSLDCLQTDVEVFVVAIQELLNNVSNFINALSKWNEILRLKHCVFEFFSIAAHECT